MATWKINLPDSKNIFSTYLGSFPDEIKSYNKSPQIISHILRFVSLLSECTYQRVALRALCVLSKCFAIICSFLFNIFSTNTRTHTHLQKNKTQMYLQLFDDACTTYSPRFLQVQFLFRGDYNIVCFNGKLARPHSVALTRHMRLRAHLRRIARGI